MKTDGKFVRSSFVFNIRFSVPNRYCVVVARYYVQGKVDCTTQTVLCARYDVKSYPSIKMFAKGQPTEYTGGRTAADLVSYVGENKKPAITVVSSLSEVGVL